MVRPTTDSAHASHDPDRFAQNIRAMGDIATWGPTFDAAQGIGLRLWAGRRCVISNYSGGGLSFERSAQHIGDEFDHYLLFAFLHKGSVTVTRDGQTVTHTPGDVAAVRLDRPYQSLTEPGSVATIIYTPTALLRSRGIDIRRINGNVWEAGTMCEAVIELTGRILNSTDPHHAQVLENGLIEILVGVLAAHDSDDRGDDVTEQTRARVLAYIDAHYTETDLDADRIAAALGASRRYLYGLFEGRGPSIATLIRNRRAAHAEQLLINEPSFSVRKIAMLAGFGSEDRLLRTFKTTTGQSPSAYRKGLHSSDAGNTSQQSVHGIRTAEAINRLSASRQPEK